MTASARRFSTWVSLLSWLAVTFVAAVLGSLASLDAPTFYAQLDKPAWAPPAWVFGPVWTVLYLLMAVAAWQVSCTPESPARRLALGLYLAQLVANALWSWLFFGWRQGAWAMAEVLLLWALVAATALAFARLRRSAGALLGPYLAWVSFASGLTWAVWQRNPGLL